MRASQRTVPVQGAGTGKSFGREAIQQGMPLHADALVLPSRWEGFGNVLVEAMSFGCQLIVNQSAGAPRELVENGKLGFLYEQGNIDSLQAAIQACREKPIPSKTLFDKSQKFRPAVAVAAYSELFSELSK